MRISAPRSEHTASFSAEPAVTATRVPKARASWMACVPMPLAPPWISSNAPGCSRAVIIRLDHTVHATSGRAAASTSPTPSGTGISWAAGTATNSA